jgi:hypothetical protein
MIPFDQNRLITLVGAVVVAMVLALVFAGGRMGALWRGRLELATALILYPAVCFLWASRAYDRFAAGEALYGALFLAVFGVFAWMGVQSIRRRSLTPFAKTTP